MTRNYQYGEVFNSLLRYLGNVANRIHAIEPDLPKLKVVYLDSIADFAKLPDGDFIFLSGWTLNADGDGYGDIHDMLLGFAAVNDVNGYKLESIYMNQLMKEIAYITSTDRTKIPIYSANGSEHIGILVFSTDFFTTEPRVDDSRTFRSVKVTMLSPQRLEAQASSNT